LAPQYSGKIVTQIASLLLETFRQTLMDVAPIAVVISVFQALAFRRAPPRLGQILIGLAAIVTGISLFRAGLGLSLVPMGDGLAERLAYRVAEPEYSTLLNALWLVVFAGLLGFAATMIEPTVTGIADRVRELTGGALHPLSFRLVVATGVAVGLILGTSRILAGFSFFYLAAPLILMVGVMAILAPRALVPLALDSGSMATSVVTVPIIAAFGASLARHLPGRDPLTDGFGLVLLALLTPIACLLLFAQVRLQLDRARNGGK
jgi:hypothetical protein